MILVFAAILGADDAPPADEREVQRLVGRARTGDAEAARALYRMHAGRVFRAVRGLCASEADAEDAVQEAFAAALPKLDDYRYRPGTRFVAWLCTLAFNAARKRSRSARRTEPMDGLDPAESLGIDEHGHRPDALAERAQRRRLLLTAMAALSERDREVVSLRYGAGLTAPEVAEALSLSPANVRKICKRQRAWLLERLKPLRPGEEEVRDDAG